jgi:hypothetical protein
MIVELANSYILALNQGQVPNIENAWTNVCSFEQERAFKESLRFFQSEVKERIKNSMEDIGSTNVKSVLNTVRDEAMKQLKKNFLGDLKSIEGFEKKLKAEIKNQSKQIVKDTQQKIDE